MSSACNEDGLMWRLEVVQHIADLEYHSVDSRALCTSAQAVWHNMTRPP